MLHMHIFYEVELGDSLLDICLRFKINMAIIMELNDKFVGRDLNRIQVGELIRIQ